MHIFNTQITEFTGVYNIYYAHTICKILYMLFSFSGGIHRDWEGLPRRYFSPITREERCACVNDKDLNHPKVNLYSNCAPDARECQTRPPGNLH